MKITMFSNYLNHHQLPLCEAFLKLTDGDFRFVAEDPITQVRLNFGYEDMNQKDFVVRAYESKAAAEEAERLAVESDIIIIGAAKEKYVRMRNRLGKPTFKYNERPFKRFRSRFSQKLWQGLHFGKPVYMLCSGGYVAKDYAALGAYKNKCYNWGYFPKTEHYPDIKELIQKKNKKYLLWVGRFISCKHAEQAIHAAEQLKNQGCDFRLDMIGTGELRPKIRKMAAEKGLEGYVYFPGSHPLDTIRKQMEKASVLILTSDKQEGWGAVVNEAMNSGCAVVSSHFAGSAATLINQNENGMCYRFGDVNDLSGKLKYLLENPKECERIGLNAYETIVSQWNAENAAKRFVELAEAVLNGNTTPDLFADGVCSRSPIIKDRSLTAKQ